MPEVILPCPACGSIDCECLFAEDEMYSVDCVDCSMRGPAERNPDSAIAEWNTLPRALRWTNEPPKVEGWYWCRLSRLNMARCVEVYGSEDGLRCGSGDSWQEPSMPVESEGFEWAGPIAPPIE